jgi:hypothetical protein
VATFFDIPGKAGSCAIAMVIRDAYCAFIGPC